MADIKNLQAAYARKLPKETLNILRDILRIVNTFKADRDTDAVEGNVAVLDADGNAVDSNLAIPAADLVDLSSSQTLTNKTLVSAILTSPYIGSFANATHDHSSNAEGGSIEETLDDRVAAFLQEGSNITLTYSDALNTLTIAAATIAHSTPVTKTDDYAVSMDDAGKTIRLNSASNKTFTLPSGNSDNDGVRLRFSNLGAGRLTLQCAAGQTVWDSTTAGTIYTDTTGDLEIEYCHDNTSWTVFGIKDTWTTT